MRNSGFEQTESASQEQQQQEPPQSQQDGGKMIGFYTSVLQRTLCG